MTNQTQHEIGMKALFNKKTAEIIKLIDTKQFDPKSLIGKVKLKKSVSASLKLMPLKWVKDNYKLFYVDSETLQRFLQEWKKAKIDSYLSTVFGGLAHKDLFQLADIKNIVKAYEKRLDDETLSTDEKAAIKDSYDYFKSLEDQGYTFLVLDGQHRLKYLFEYLNNEITFDVLKDYFSEIDRGVQEAFSAKDPKLKEKILDNLRWKELDNLESGHQFDVTKLCIYKLRLMICEKWINRQIEKGETNLESIVEHFYNSHKIDDQTNMENRIND